MRLFLSLALCLVSHFSFGQSAPTFAQISITRQAEQALPLGPVIEFEVTVDTPQKYRELLREWEGVSVNRVTQNTLTIALKEEYRSIASVIDQYRKSSFVIDYDEPQVQTVLEQFKQQYGAPPTLPIGDALEGFVSGYITEPTYIHDFAFASTVATTKSGDCTEFAVLTTALARALGTPSRVAVGTVIVENAEAIEAYGHAWNELFIDDKWVRVDAALATVQSVRKFYLPGHVLDNEGLGYALAFGKSAFTLPQRIADVRAVR